MSITVMNIQWRWQRRRRQQQQQQQQQLVVCLHAQAIKIWLYQGPTYDHQH